MTKYNNISPGLSNYTIKTGKILEISKNKSTFYPAIISAMARNYSY